MPTLRSFRYQGARLGEILFAKRVWHLTSMWLNPKQIHCERVVKRHRHL